MLTLEKASVVEIHLFDAKGTLIKKVFSGKRDAGIQEFTIDGSQLANGVYFCEIRVIISL